jgi:hypothetical protein
MTIPFEEIKARLLADPEVQREYDALAPEFEALRESLIAKQTQAIKPPSSRRILETDSNLPPKPPQYSPAHQEKTVKSAHAANR